MIIDKLDHFRCYQRCVPELWDAVRFAQRAKDEYLPAGRYDRIGKGFAFVQEGETRLFDAADFEVHRNYFDVQILLEGKEYLEYTERENLKVKTPYDKESDIEWLSGTGDRILITPGMFYLVYPWDAHKPCCHASVQTSYRKAVVKIKIDKLIHGVQTEPCGKTVTMGSRGRGGGRWI